MEFGLIFFSNLDADGGADGYRLLLESSASADALGFASVWIPERHFTGEGSLYPNPAVVHAALARTTKRIRLCAGSVVAPLHSPFRIAEEWAVVDRLSGGRVSVSFASGWHPNDFVLAPEHYAERRSRMEQVIEDVRKLWRGEAVIGVNGAGTAVPLKSFPRPVQRELPIGLTAAENVATFELAGRLGADILTHAFNLSIEQIAEFVARYRAARSAHGHDPESGRVTLMLHTYVADDEEAALALGRSAFCKYLESASHLLKGIAKSRGQELAAEMSPQARADYAAFVFERLLHSGRVLFGSPKSCLTQVRKLEEAGIDEVASQIDFGVPTDVALQGIGALNRLRELTVPEPVSVQATRERGQRAEEHRSTLAGGELLATARRACPTPADVSTFYAGLGGRGIELGEDFRGIRRLWQGVGQALGECVLPESAGPHTSQGQMHPALVDACSQVLVAAVPAALLSANPRALFLPARMREFDLPCRGESTVWSHATLTEPVRGDADQLVGDVVLYDRSGTVLGALRGLALSRIGTGPSAAATEWLYELDWVPSPAAALEVGAGEKTQWLVLGDRHDVGVRLAAILRDRGENCALATVGDEFARNDRGEYTVRPASRDDLHALLRAVVATPERPRDADARLGIVHLFSMDAPAPDGVAPATAFESSQRFGPESVLALAQEVLRTKAATARLWVVTRSAQAVIEGDRLGGVLQSSVWGLGRTLAQEHPELGVVLVDLDGGATLKDCASTLARELGDGAGEDQVALRADRRYAARIRKRSPAAANPCVVWRADRTYVVSGGLGDLGLAIARAAVSKGARHLLLLGRKSLPARKAWSGLQPTHPMHAAVTAVRALEAMGAEVRVAPVDVADTDALRAVLEAHSGPPFGGVLHLAGVAEGQAILNLDAGLLEQVARPKVLGALVLDALLASAPLEFFAVFSSPASVLGIYGHGGGNYAAANSFLDAFAHARRARGQPAISINWGPWADIGLAARSAHSGRLTASGIGALGVERSLDLLDHLLVDPAAQTLVMSMDWAACGRAYGRAMKAPLYELVRVASSEGTDGQDEASQLAKAIRATPRADRPALIELYLRREAAMALGGSPDDVPPGVPLAELGVDSLIAIDIRTRIERDFGLLVSFTTLFEGATIASLVAMVDEWLANAKPEPRNAPRVTATTRSALVSRLEQMGDEAIDELLASVPHAEEVSP